MSSLTTNSLPGSERGSGDDEGMIQVHCSAKMPCRVRSVTEFYRYFVGGFRWQLES